jgi:hypothetical protein
MIPRDKTELEVDFERSVAFALKSCKFSRPRTHDASERDRYFAMVAQHIRKHLELSWKYDHKSSSGDRIPPAI